MSVIMNESMSQVPAADAPSFGGPHDAVFSTIETNSGPHGPCIFLDLQQGPDTEIQGVFSVATMTNLRDKLTAAIAAANGL